MKYLSLLLLSVLSAHAENLDVFDQQALEKTQALLKNPAFRQDALKDTDAKNADLNVQSLAGSPANVEKIYGISSDVFAQLVKDAGGDTEKLNLMLQELGRNPAGLESKLTPEQRQQIQDIALSTAKK